MGVTLKDIAKAAGVSEGTASLAMNNRGGVSEKTKREVISIAHEMGYITSMSARSLSQNGRTKTIGVLVPNISNLFYSQLVQQIESELRKIGYEMIFATTDSNETYEEEMIARFVSFRVEGAIVYPSIQDNRPPSYFELLRKNNIPMVFVGSYYEGINESHIMSDIEDGIEQAVDYLCEKGCKNIHYFGGAKEIVSNQMKVDGIKRSFFKNKLSFNEDTYIELPNTDYAHSYEAINRLLESEIKVDGILAGDAYSSLAIYNALHEHGFGVPEDVQIISFDNLINPNICVAKLSCIEQNVTRIVKKSLEVLISRIQGNTVITHYMMDTKLIIRDTTF
ncbi:LacI family DNA-binding transcriptional regulator [Tetragenococcus solitarius]|uniref:LacI family DNA-binding transcriptional regulator n=1 Tax=Tetragenococcus solitarius TaxID=71453 RepID=A0ABN3YAS0_9ENTE|nr:LacI family DNA-binding transcriptional regulator [Tetragenococcus solitarius]